MKKEIDVKGQLSMIDHTEIGEQIVDFIGSDYDHKKDHRRLFTKFLEVFKIVKNWDWFSYDELYKVTHIIGINDDTASRCVRRIDEINYMGYSVLKNEKVRPILFKVIKLDK